MATKTINLDETAYAILVRLKMNDRDSFSRVVKRSLGGRAKVDELFGILKGAKGKQLAKTIGEQRRLDRQQEKVRIKKMSEAIR